MTIALTILLYAIAFFIMSSNKLSWWKQYTVAGLFIIGAVVAS